MVVLFHTERKTLFGSGSQIIFKIKEMKPDLIIQSHCIDDQATTAELALEQFQHSFPYTRVNVWEDGTGMTYEFKQGNIESLGVNAKEIIAAQNLPLSVRAFKNWEGHSFLIIEFKIKKEQL